VDQQIHLVGQVEPVLLMVIPLELQEQEATRLRALMRLYQVARVALP
jgi:hypothetical protein